MTTETLWSYQSYRSHETTQRRCLVEQGSRP